MESIERKLYKLKCRLYTMVSRVEDIDRVRTVLNDQRFTDYEKMAKALIAVKEAQRELKDSASALVEWLEEEQRGEHNDKVGNVVEPPVLMPNPSVSND